MTHTHAKVIKLYMIRNSPGMLPAVLGYRDMGSHQIVTETLNLEQFQNRLGEWGEAEHLECVKGYRLFMPQAVAGFFHLASLA